MTSKKDRRRFQTAINKAEDKLKLALAYLNDGALFTGANSLHAAANAFVKAATIRRAALGLPAVRYNTPTKEGYWWAKVVRVSRMPTSAGWGSLAWEIVEVVDNNGAPGEEFMVKVHGVEHWQPLGAFEWGPPVRDTWGRPDDDK